MSQSTKSSAQTLARHEEHLAGTASSRATLTPAGYRRLQTDLSKLIDGAKTRAREAALPILVKAYWRVGERIEKERLTSRANYASSILRDLSTDLGIHERTLQYAVTFFQTYPSPPSNKNVGWAHYRELLRIRDDDEREFYEFLTEREQLSRDALVAAIRDDRYAPPPTGKRSRGSGNKQNKLLRPEDPTFIYEAYPRRVIDGDTLLLDIDLGFEVVKRHRIRLASVDAPPLKTANGKAAHRYVRDELARAVEVVIKTHRVDPHGRYVADVFYATREMPRGDVFSRGRYLNQRLLDEGLAVAAKGGNYR